MAFGVSTYLFDLKLFSHWYNFYFRLKKHLFQEVHKAMNFEIIQKKSTRKKEPFQICPFFHCDFH